MSTVWTIRSLSSPQNSLMERSLPSKKQMASCCSRALRSRRTGPIDLQSFLALVTSTDLFSSVSALAPNSTLLGSNIKEAALISQWNSLIDHEIAANYLLTIQLLSGTLTPYSKPVGCSHNLQNLYTSISPLAIHYLPRALPPSPQNCRASLGNKNFPRHGAYHTC